MRRNDFLPIVAGLLLTLASCSSEEPAPKPTPEPDKPLIEPDKPSDEEDNEKYTPYQVDMTGFDIRNYLPQETGVSVRTDIEPLGLSTRFRNYEPSSYTFGARVLDFTDWRKWEKEFRIEAFFTEVRESKIDSTHVSPISEYSTPDIFYRIFRDVLQKDRPILFTKQERRYKHRDISISWASWIYPHWAVVPSFIEDLYRMKTSDFTKKYHSFFLTEYTLGYSGIRYIAHTLPGNIKNPLPNFSWELYSELPKEQKERIDKHLKSYYVSSITGGYNDEYIDTPMVLTAEAREKWRVERGTRRANMDIMFTYFGCSTTSVMVEDNMYERMRAAYSGEPFEDIQQEPYIEIARYEIAPHGEIVNQDYDVYGPAYDLVPILHTRDGSRIVFRSKSDTLNREEATAILSYHTKEGLAKEAEVLREQITKLSKIRLKVNPEKIYKEREARVHALMWSPFVGDKRLRKHWDARTNRLFVFDEKEERRGTLLFYKPSDVYGQRYDLMKCFENLPERAMPLLYNKDPVVGI